MKWMKLEPIIHSEVSQKEKTKYHILVHIYGIQKDGTNEPICRAALETQRELTTDMGSGEEGAAAAAKSLQSCLTLCDPIDVSPLGSSVPGILQARILEWVAISFSNA